DQDADHLRFRIRNNMRLAVDRDVQCHVADKTYPAHVRAAALSDSEPLILPATGLLPGTNALTIDSGDGSPLIGSVTNWLIRADPATAWENMPLAGLFNDRLTPVFQHKYLSPRSPFCSL